MIGLQEMLLVEMVSYKKICQVTLNFCFSRSSRLEVFCRKDFLRHFAKFTGKHLCQSLCFNKVADLRPATLLKKRFWHRCFPVNFAKFLRTTLFTQHLRWLLLFFVFFQKPVALKMSILSLWFNIAFTTRRIIQIIHSYSSEELI